MGNYRFLGATDNIPKRAGSPADYFSRLKSGGVDISTASSSSNGVATTILFHNAHLSMSLKGRGFAFRGLIPRGILGSAWRDQRCVELPEHQALIG